MEIARDVTVTISVFPKGSILRLSKEGGGSNGVEPDRQSGVNVYAIRWCRYLKLLTICWFFVIISFFLISRSVFQAVLLYKLPNWCTCFYSTGPNEMEAVGLAIHKFARTKLLKISMI